MSIRKQTDGAWLCECYPQGRKGKRLRKKFATKGEALAFERFTMREIEDKPWLGEKGDNRRLTDLLELWYSLYGISLGKGDVIRNKMLRMAEAMNNPIAPKFDSKVYSNFRQLRLSGDISFVDARWQKGKPSIATLNSELARFKAVFSKLKELGEWKAPNPLEDIRPLKDHEREMAFLSQEQIKSLLHHVSLHSRQDMLKIVKICLSTGARWNEAAQLRGSQLNKHKVTFTNTKNKKNRSIPISEELYNEIHKPTSGKLFEECYTPFSYILKNKIGAELPSGQATHVLRHTFASHFMMNGGNILVLKDILGHADITMTMRYAHFAPEHLSDAITKNPLSSL
ncbi:tyrosine-type recombinase/integrase [Photobacterium sagamiensis]|uniref:phage integrase n=1 Tax=Photobacterium sagamiensis TaxID=2910241 RepID=UPI003D1066DF